MSTATSKRSPQRPYIALFTVLFDPVGPHDEDRLAPLQALRAERDRAASRWAPHLTVIPPFDVQLGPRDGDEVAEDEEEEARGDVAAGGQPPTSTAPYTSLHLKAPSRPSNSDSASPYRLAPHERTAHCAALRRTLARLEDAVEARLLADGARTSRTPRTAILDLDDVGHFALRAYHTVHLRPSPRPEPGHPTAPELQALRTSLADAIQTSGSRATPLTKREHQQAKQDLKPHLTLGQGKTVAEREAIYQRAWAFLEGAPLRCHLRRVQLMFKPKGQGGPYLVWREFDL